MPRNFRPFTSILIVLLAIVVIGGLVWANTLYARTQETEKQFLVPWLGARTFLQYGVSPYDDQASVRAQLIYYGHQADETEDPMRSYTPFPVELFYFPFALVTDYALARGLWMTLGELALAATVILCLSITEWKPSRFLLPILLLFIIFWNYSFQALLHGSAAPVAVFGFLGSLAALKSKRDELAGTLLTLTFLQPSITMLALFFALWWMIASKRWRILIGFSMVAGFFTFVAFLLIPGWFMPFLRGLVTHYRIDPGITVARLLTEWWPAAGSKFALVLTLILVLVLILEWRSMRQGDFRHQLWTACLVMSVAPLIGIPTSLDGHILLFLPLILLFSISSERWRSNRTAIIIGAVLVVLYFLLWAISSSAHALFLVLPILMLGGLYWMRWWAVHPPRTWVDAIRK